MHLNHYLLCVHGHNLVHNVASIMVHDIGVESANSCPG